MWNGKIGSVKRAEMPCLPIVKSAVMEKAFAGFAIAMKMLAIWRR